MTIFACDIPLASVLDRQVIKAAYFRDSYIAPLKRPDASVVDIFFAIFGHHPVWIKALLIVSNQVAKLCGLEVPTVADILLTKIQSHYAVGDTIGPWPIFSLSQTELVAGRNNKHLDFRLSVLKIVENQNANVVISTICSVHNVYGKIYLFFIVPFHKWGVRRMLSSAIAAGRL